MDTLYFSHDYNASKDPKLLRVRKQLGHAGIGLYWELIELLYKNDNAIAIADLDAIAIELDADEEALQHLINDFGLFEKTDEYVFSPSINKRIEKRQEISDKRREAINSRYKNKKNDTSVEQVDTSVIQNSTSVLQNSTSVEQIDTSVIQNSTSVLQNSTSVEQVDTSVIQNSTSVLQNALKEKEKEKNNYIPPTPLREGGRKQKFDFSLSQKPEWVDAKLAQVFKTWIDYKRSRGQAYANESTARTCYEQLVEYSAGNTDQAAQIVRTSIANNWHGLFALDKPQQARTNPMVIDTSKSNFQKF